MIKFHYQNRPTLNVQYPVGELLTTNFYHAWHKLMHGSVRSKVKDISNNMISLECDIESRLQIWIMHSSTHAFAFCHFSSSSLGRKWHWKGERTCQINWRKMYSIGLLPSLRSSPPTCLAVRLRDNISWSMWRNFSYTAHLLLQEIRMD